MKSFSALLALCEGNPRVTGGFPSQRPVTRSFDIFFDLCLNKWLNNQSRHRWFDKPSRPLWRHYYVETSAKLVGRTFNETEISQFLWNLYHWPRRTLSHCRFDNFRVGQGWKVNQMATFWCWWICQYWKSNKIRSYHITALHSFLQKKMYFGACLPFPIPCFS